MTPLFGFCGRDTSSYTAVLAAMAGPAAAASRSIEARSRDGGIALLVGPAGEVYGDDLGTAAVVGRPRWRGELAAEAARVGHAATLLRAFSERGVQALTELYGAFACVARDARTGTTLLAVDRMGIWPLAFHQRDGLLVFSTSAQGVARHPAVGATLDPQALFDYFYFHVIPSPATVFAKVRKLEPAQALLVGPAELRCEHYWNPQFTARSAVGRQELAARTRSVLQTAVARCRRVPQTGAFLSGGIDSSTVVGMLRSAAAEAPRAYSIGFDEERYNELEYARTTARHFGSRLTEYRVTAADVSAGIHHLVAACDEPFGNSSILPAYHCARVAREDGIDLLLAGDGGDELFAGNERYAKNHLFESYLALPALLRNALEAGLTAAPWTDRATLLRKARRFVTIANTPLPDRLQDYNFLHRTPLPEIFTAALLAQVDPTRPLAMLRETYARARAVDVIDKMLYLDWKFTLADNDLRKVNMACDAAGVEVGYPFLDDDVVELSTCIPGSWKLEGRRLRAFFKDALADFLPQKVLGKHKHGFGLPFGVWLRTDRELRDLAQTSTAAFARRGYVRPEYIDKLLAAHTTEHATYFGTMIWLIIVMELWLSARRL